MIGIAGSLIKKARAEERRRCIRLLLKHVRRQSSDRCCDNCNCQGVKRALEELSKPNPGASQ